MISGDFLTRWNAIIVGNGRGSEEKEGHFWAFSYFWIEVFSLVLICRRCTCDMAAGTAWDTVPMPNRSGRQHWSSQSLSPACARSWFEFNFAGMPVVKLWDGSSCRWRMYSFVPGSSPDGTGGYVARIHRPHMRINQAFLKEVLGLLAYEGTIFMLNLSS